ncbi:dihydrofolate reductase family protein [Alkalicoccobacillus gibsonii]|uniref:Dihydrofolate reductase family protein n=1 Tax=Alkalicoccobacillus gibsonii TaxID=79881 RepID=A0ABU9VEN5_9BACI
MTKNRNVVLFIATSLDGYIATEEERLEWLFEVEGEGDNGFSDFYSTIDTVIMGRKTYDWIANVDNMEEYPYKDKKGFVLTRSSMKNDDYTTFGNPDLEQLISQLKEQDGKKIWLVGGGQLVTAFLEKGLIDEVFITVAPTIIGKGIPLFNPGEYQSKLQLEGVKTFNQFVELHYTVKKNI